MTSRTPFPGSASYGYERPAAGKSASEKTADVSAALSASYQTVLEKDFPRILTTIQSMWGYPELNRYFRTLTLDNRGDREGFPKEAWEEIFTLLYLHQIIVPEPLY